MTVGTSSARALLRRDCLHPDALPHWLVSPWFLTHWDHWVFPLEFGGRLLYVSTGGLVLFLPQAETGVVSVEGVTGDNKCDFRIERDHGIYHVDGTFEAQPVSVQIELSPGRIQVEGPAAYVRSEYAMVRQGDAWTVSGMTGESESMYRVVLEKPGHVRLEGWRRGEDVDSTIRWDGDALRFEDGDDQFVLQPRGQALALSGRLAQEPAELTFTLSDEDELRVVGSTSEGKMDFRILDEGNGVSVKGRYYRWFVNYRVLLKS
ncbi:MAG TPA: hypothetical protein VGO93_04950 [Candidatus Xenobia bacterium]|jgi:hypothetical protein